MGLKDALKVSKLRSERGDFILYKARISEAWCIGGIPHGGYAVGLILSAVGDLQSSSPHPDPVHLTAHYLQSADISECEIHIMVIRKGKTFTNLDAELTQNGKTKITARLIYGILPDLTLLSSSASSQNLTLLPTSPYGRRIPLSKHPALVTLDKPNDKYLYQNKAEDRFFEEQNARRAGAQTDNSEPHTPDCGVEWGAWLELKDPDDVLEIPMIPFFADCMKNLPSLLPPDLRPGPSWFATVVLTVEFKSRIPSSMLDPHTRYSPFSPRTVGVYASSRFMTEGRHDEFVEVWTTPSTIGSHSSRGDSDEEVDPKWRENQICLAISTQMALTIPEEDSRRTKSRL
ncbi:hypothetical protein ACEPAG_8281 [Sanghuangporus baumii]